MADTQTTDLGATAENLAETVVAMGTTISRLGVTVATLPLAVLPAPTRENVTATANNLVDTLGSLYLNVAKVTIRGIGDVTRELGKAIDPAGAPANKPIEPAVVVTPK